MEHVSLDQRLILSGTDRRTLHDAADAPLVCDGECAVALMCEDHVYTDFVRRHFCVPCFVKSYHSSLVQPEELFQYHICSPRRVVCLRRYGRVFSHKHNRAIL